MDREAARILSFCKEFAEQTKLFRDTTYHSSVLEPDTVEHFAKNMHRLRFDLAAELETATDDTITLLFTAEHGPLAWAWLVANTLAHLPLATRERKRLSTIRKIAIRDPSAPESLRSIMIFALYRQPMELNSLPTPHEIEENLLRGWIRVLLMNPAFRLPRDERRFVRHQKKVLDSLLSSIEIIRNWSYSYRDTFFEAVRDFLTFGTTFFFDLPVGQIMRARGRLIRELRDWFGDDDAVDWSPPERPIGRKIRIGILTRNLLNYTDTMVIFGHFNAFDQGRYSIYIYSAEVDDPNVHHNLSFYRDVWALPVKVVHIPKDLRAAVAAIREDDLDFFVLGTAYIGLELLIAHRLARVQIALNSLLPSTTGLKSFDFIATSRLATRWLRRIPQEVTEDVVTYEYPLVCYRRHAPATPSPHVSRATFGISEDAVMYYNFHSIQKLVPGTLRCWISVLDRVPNSVLVLSPYNPAWGDSAHAVLFENRLRSALSDYPNVSRDRIVVTGPLPPNIAESLFLLCDIFFGSFPHGGATSMTMCLSHGVPCVVRASPSLRGTADATMLAASNLPELIGKSPTEYARIAIELGRDPQKRDAVREKMAALGPSSPVFDISAGSKSLQSLFDVLWSRLLPVLRAESRGI